MFGLRLNQCLIAVCLGWLAMPIVHAEMSRELDVRGELESLGASLMLTEDVGQRDAAIENALRGVPATPGGVPKLSLISSGIEFYFTSAFLGKKDAELQSHYAELTRQVDDWIAKRSQQSLPLIAKSQMMLAYAASVRGTGAGNKVDAAVWPAYEAQLNKTKDWLLAQQTVGQTSPLWYMQMMVVARLQSDSEARWKWLAEGAKQFPEYRDIYTTAIDAALPLGGGSAADIERVAQSARGYAKPEFADIVYATVWSEAVFREPSIARQVAAGSIGDWQAMKRGWDMRVARYPDNWSRNGYAAMACLLGDRASYSVQIEQLDGDIIPQAWPKAVSYRQCQSQ